MPFSYERARQELLAEKAKLIEQLGRLDTTASDDIGHSNHMADDATEAFEQTVGVALHRTVVDSLEEVERALAKLDDGTYGICESCGARIDRARLKALPHVLYCFECQSRRESQAPRSSRR